MSKLPVAAAAAALLAWRLIWVYRALGGHQFEQLQRSRLQRALIDAFVGVIAMAGEASVGAANPVIIRRLLAAALADDVYRGIRYSALAVPHARTLDVHAPARFLRASWGVAAGGGGGGPAGLPVLVFVHGGAWAWSRGWQHSPLAAHWARCGAVCVNVDYRLYPVADAVDQATDVAHALAWVSEHAASYGGDPRRVFLMGHSSGAHVAALALLLHPAAAAAVAGAIMLCGVFDVRAHYAFEGARSLGGGAVRGVEWLSPLAPACGGVARFEAVSPLHLVSSGGGPVRVAALPPFTLLHAADDVVVPPSQSAAFAAALRAAGGCVNLVPSYAGAGHMDLVVDPMVGYSAGCTARLTEDVFAAVAAAPTAAAAATRSRGGDATPPPPPPPPPPPHIRSAL